MILQVFLLEAANQNMLLGSVPESLELLIFGAGLIGLTIGLRRVLKKSEKDSINKIEEVREVSNR